MSSTTTSRWLGVLQARGVDGATVYATLAHLTSLLLGPITALFIAGRLQPSTQGYYYTFGSLTTVQVLFGAGLGQVVMQVASHEWPRLRIDQDGWLVGDRVGIARLSALLSSAVRWCVGLGVLLAGSLVLLGSVVFGQQAIQDGVSWKAPWLALSLLICVNFALSPAWALLQGCGQIRKYYLFHWVHLILNAVTIWISVSAGLALWAVPFATTVGIVWCLVYLTVSYRRFFQCLLDAPPASSFHWAREMWPLQWRSWLSWVSTSLTIQALVPISFRLDGAEAAGQLGMTITLTNVIAAVASNAVLTKGPLMGALAAERRFVELDALYTRAVATSSFLLAAAAASATAAFYVAAGAGLPIVGRILPPLSLLAMLAAASAMAVVGWLGAYVRAFKREPFAVPFCVWSLATLALTTLASTFWHGPGVVAGYVSGILVFLLPVTFVIFRTHRRVSSLIPASASDGP